MCATFPPRTGRRALPHMPRNSTPRITTRRSPTSRARTAAAPICRALARRGRRCRRIRTSAPTRLTSPPSGRSRCSATTRAMTRPTPANASATATSRMAARCSRHSATPIKAGPPEPMAGPTAAIIGISGCGSAPRTTSRSFPGSIAPKSTSSTACFRRPQPAASPFPRRYGIARAAPMRAPTARYQALRAAFRGARPSSTAPRTPECGTAISSARTSCLRSRPTAAGPTAMTVRPGPTAPMTRR